jgi:hypothetical protein
MRAAVAVLLLVACSPPSAAPPNGPASRATPSSGSATREPGAAPSATLTCSDAIGSDLPPRDLAVVLGVVALPTSEASRFALQTALSGERDPAARLFAKQGLLIRTGVSFEIVVPDEVASRFAIGWGSPARRTRDLVVGGCPSGSCAADHGSAICDSSSAWLAYPGGYWVQQVGCLPLLVRAAGREQRALIGVGAPCPGQRLPPAPTQI